MRTLLLIALLVLPALFAAAEVALLRLRPSQVQELTDEGRPGAQSVPVSYTHLTLPTT